MDKAASRIRLRILAVFGFREQELKAQYLKVFERKRLVKNFEASLSFYSPF